ncbi:MAG: imelysin family protein [Nannocystales bacterium]
MSAFVHNVALFSLAAGSLALACDSSDGGPQDASTLPTGAEIMRDTVQTTIVPDITAFDTAAQDMRTDVDAFCSAPSSDSLAELQARWRSLSEAWNAVAPYNFGPLDDDVITPKIIFIESMRQRGTDYTQTVRDGILRGIEGTDALDVDYFGRQTFDEVGMLALEVLVFEDSREGNSADPADVLADFEASPRKCDALKGLSELLAGCAATVRSGWTESFADGGEPFAETMAGPELADGTEPVAALLIVLQEHLDYIKVRKLEGILDAELSGHFYPNVLATLEAMEELLAQPSDESFGLLERMEATGNADEVATVLANFEAARQAATDMDREALTAAVGLLDGNLKREIPDALGVELGLTFTDGD